MRAWRNGSLAQFKPECRKTSQFDPGRPYFSKGKNMNKRRKRGDRVWVGVGAGFGASSGEWATIIDDPEYNPTDKEGRSEESCWCGDPTCQEWPNLSRENGKSDIYHVGECKMLDEPAPEFKEP